MIYPERTFKLWDASPTKNTILLRSPKNSVEDVHTNVDILFFGTTFLEISFSFKGLELREATPTEARHLRENGAEGIVYKLIGSTGQGIIIAHSYKAIENDSDIFESPLERL